MMEIVYVVLMAFTCIYMMRKANFSETRLVALVPLGMALLDGCSFGADFTAIPALYALMWAARITVWVCCYKAMREDRRKTIARRQRNASAELKLRMAAIAKAEPAQPIALYA